MFTFLDRYRLFIVIIPVVLISLFISFQIEVFAEDLPVRLPNYGRTDPVEPDWYATHCRHGKCFSECLKHRSSVHPVLHWDRDYELHQMRYTLARLRQVSDYDPSTSSRFVQPVAPVAELASRPIFELGVQSSSSHTINSEPRELFAMDIEGSSWGSKSESSFAKHHMRTVEYIKARAELNNATEAYDKEYNKGLVSKFLSQFKSESASDYARRCALESRKFHAEMNWNKILYRSAQLARRK